MCGNTALGTKSFSVLLSPVRMTGLKKVIGEFFKARIESGDAILVADTVCLGAYATKSGFGTHKKREREKYVRNWTLL